MIAMSTTLNLQSIKPSLDKLQALERELTASLIERDEVIRASLVALLSQQRLVILGPPGTGKSALVIELARRISPQNGAGLRNFAYLMTRFTTPEELFGPVSVSGLKQDEYRRITSGKLVEAELAAGRDRAVGRRRPRRPLLSQIRRARPDAVRPDRPRA